MTVVNTILSRLRNRINKRDIISLLGGIITVTGITLAYGLYPDGAQTAPINKSIPITALSFTGIGIMIYSILLMKRQIDKHAK